MTSAPLTFVDYASPLRTGPLAVLACPICSSENTHLDAVAVSAREEDRKPNEIRVDAISGKVETFAADEAPEMRGPTFENGIGRRHRIALLGWCEQGHEFSLVFAQHKGETFFEVSTKPNATMPPDVLR